MSEFTESEELRALRSMAGQASKMRARYRAAMGRAFSIEGKAAFSAASRNAASTEDALRRAIRSLERTYRR